MTENVQIKNPNNRGVIINKEDKMAEFFAIKANPKAKKEALKKSEQFHKVCNVIID